MMIVRACLNARYPTGEPVVLPILRLPTLGKFTDLKCVLAEVMRDEWEQWMAVVVDTDRHYRDALWWADSFGQMYCEIVLPKDQGRDDF